MKKIILRFIYFVLIFGSIFTDTVFQNYFDNFGRAILNLLLPFIALLYVIIYGKIRINAYIKGMLYLFVLLLAINLISDIVWNILENSTVLFAENIYVKSVKSILYWFDIVIYIILIYNCILQLKIKEIFLPFIFTFYFLFIVLIIELFTIPYAFENLHYTVDAITGIHYTYYTRVRLTTTESSTTLPLIFAFGSFTLYYYYYIVRNAIMKMFTILCLTVFFVSSGSKTKYICFILISLTVFGLNIKKIKRKQLVLYLCVFLILIGISIWGGNEFYSKFNDNRGSTYSVRTLPIVANIINAFKYPLGTGGAISGYMLSQTLNTVYRKFSATKFGSTLNFYEIKHILNSDDDKSVIAGFFYFLGQWGGVGALLWIKYTWNYIKTCFERTYRGKVIVLSTLICILFMMCFTVPFTNYYMSWAYIVIWGHLVQPLECNISKIECGKT